MLGRERGHDLRDASVSCARAALEALEQSHFFVFREAANRVVQRIERPRASALRQRSDRLPTLTRDRADRGGRLVERRKRNVVRIGVGLLVAAYRAHAHAAVDAERPGLDDALFQAPALEPRMLEIQIGKRNVMAVDVGEHAVPRAGVPRRLTASRKREERRGQSRGSPGSKPDRLRMRHSAAILLWGRRGSCSSRA